jgi:hypothetical protein
MVADRDAQIQTHVGMLANHAQQIRILKGELCASRAWAAHWKERWRELAPDLSSDSGADDSSWEPDESSSD